MCRFFFFTIALFTTWILATPSPGLADPQIASEGASPLYNPVFLSCLGLCLPFWQPSQ